MTDTARPSPRRRRAVPTVASWPTSPPARATSPPPEDALAEAFRIALDSWPTGGVPANPEAWLLTVARRSIGRTSRHAGVVAAAAPTLRLLAEEADDMPGSAFPDERLKLLFVCAHPAIDPAMHTPLMLQTVLGLEAAQIAAAFIVAPAAMAPRLVRAKQKIRDAGVAFAVPGADELPARLAAVLEAVCAAYGRAFAGIDGAVDDARSLALEAIWLARALAELLPAEPEPKGLLALLLHCGSRGAARSDRAHLLAESGETAAAPMPTGRRSACARTRRAADSFSAGSMRCPRARYTRLELRPGPPFFLSESR